MWERPKTEINANVPGVVKAYGAGAGVAVLLLAAGYVCLHAVNDNFPDPDDENNLLKKAKETLERLRKGGK